jgi:eukaryotic-like serine/threonine-protein kinase
MSALVGQSLDGRYVLRRAIAYGKRTVIYEAQNAVTNRLLAVKLLTSEHRADADARRALLEEGRMLVAAQHPCVVEAVDAGTAELSDDETTAFVAMEMLEGRTLEGLIAARAPLDPPEVLRIGIAVLRALDWMHRVGLVHGALNPRHLLLPAVHPSDQHWEVKAGDPKLLGFGSAARAATADTRSAEIADAAYLAPEQLAGTSATAQTDLYSLAVMMHEALTGERPQKKSDGAEAVVEGLPEGMMDALAAALKPSRSERPSSAQELGELLQKSKRKLPPPKPKTDASLRRRHLRAPYITPVRLIQGERTLDARCEDISHAGMLIVSTAQLPKEANLVVRFALPGTSRFVDVRSMVRWSRGSNQSACASGLSFGKLSPAATSALDKYLEVYGVAPVAS